MSGTMHYRVDTVPRWIRPTYLAATWICGSVFYLYYVVCRVTSRMTFEGATHGDLSRQAIFCMWHESWWSYFTLFIRYRSPHAVMSHPAAYMKPAHVMFRLMGVKAVVLGSSGEEGRQAANRLAALVRNGYSTNVSPDGPYGPPKVLKKGVLHIALQSGVPIVPLTIRPSRYVSLPTWDSKKIPLPFGRIRVVVHEPVRVTTDNFDEARSRLVSALGEQEAPTFPRRVQKAGPALQQS